MSRHKSFICWSAALLSTWLVNKSHRKLSVCLGPLTLPQSVKTSTHSFILWWKRGWLFPFSIQICLSYTSFKKKHHVGNIFQKKICHSRRFFSILLWNWKCTILRMNEELNEQFTRECWVKIENSYDIFPPLFIM